MLTPVRGASVSSCLWRRDGWLKERSPLVPGLNSSPLCPSTSDARHAAQRHRPASLRLAALGHNAAHLPGDPRRDHQRRARRSRDTTAAEIGGFNDAGASKCSSVLRTRKSSEPPTLVTPMVLPLSCSGLAMSCVVMNRNAGRSTQAMTMTTCAPAASAETTAGPGESTNWAVPPKRAATALGLPLMYCKSM